jgi:hypothetical protein
MFQIKQAGFLSNLPYQTIQQAAGLVLVKHQAASQQSRKSSL